MPAIGWDVIMPAIQEWVVAASGLPDGVVFWERQGGPPIDGDHITLDITDTRGVGQDWIVHDDNPTPTPGAELRRRAQGHRMATLVLECFSAGFERSSAVTILTDVAASIELYAYELDVAGVGIHSVSQVRYVAGTRGGQLAPRARCEVTLHLASEATAFDTYVERFHVNVNAENPAGDPLTAVEKWVPDDPS